MSDPMTAEQINRPQTGQITPPGPTMIDNSVKPRRLPDKVLQQRFQQAQESPVSIAGWWAKSIDGSIPKILEAVANDPKIPDHWKASIKGDIEARKGDNNYVLMDLHCTVHEGSAIYHFRIALSKKLI